MGTLGSTQDLYNTLAARQRTFAPGLTRAYHRKPGAGAVDPYTVMLLHGLDHTGADGGGRMEGYLEVMVFHRGDQNAGAAELICDQLITAFTQCRIRAVDGLFHSTRCSQRDTLPAGGTEVDNDVVQIRLMFDVVWWPGYVATFLTS